MEQKLQICQQNIAKLNEDTSDQQYNLKEFLEKVAITNAIQLSDLDIAIRDIKEVTGKAKKKYKTE